MIGALLRLYPAAFRARYGSAMRQFHRERVRAGVRAVDWVSIVADHVRSAVAEHIRVVATRRDADRRGLAVSALGQDIRFAARALARRRAFTAVVVATIAVGVGANTAIFSVLHGILLRPLPYAQPDRVMALGHEAPTWLASQPEYVDYRAGLRSFEIISAFTQQEGNLASGDEPERISLAIVTPDFFTTVGMRPLVGRTFEGGEDLVFPAEVVVLSHGLWQRRFAGDVSVIGRSVQLNGRDRTVIGVMPPNFDYPTERTDMWLPMRRFHADSLGDRTNHYLFLVGRLRAGVDYQTARTEAHAVARRMMADHADRYDPKYPLTPVLTPVNEALVGATRPYMWALFGAVGFVLLIVCVNVAHLLLARGEGRRREMALRGALGASRGRLVLQLLAESMMLAVSGGALGVVLAWLSQRALVALSPPSIPRLDEIALNGTVLVYALAVSLVAGLLFGMMPALRVSREAPAEMLKQGGRGERHGSSRRVRQSLVVAEVALAVVMVAGAGMLVRSLINLQSKPLGFDPHSVLTAKVSLTAGRYDDTRATNLFAQVLERVRATPGVEAAGAAGWLPVVEAGGLWGVLAEGQSYERLAQGPTAAPQQVTPGYFAAMGMTLRGRDFTDRDDVNAPFVGIVSDALARQLWPDEEAIGKRFRLGGGSVFVTVVGVTSDIRARGFDDTPEPTMYFPFAQTAVTAYFMPRSMNLVIRTAADPMGLAPRVRAVVRELDTTIPVSSVRTLDAVVGTSVASRRFSTMLITAFAAIALLLAGLGIYGVVTYGVSERMYEIGVRVALGAERRNIMSLVVTDSTRMAVAGFVIGLAGAAALARALRSMLVDLPVFDVVTMLVVCVLLAGVVIAATIVPAHRATAIEPTEVFRD